MSTIRTEYMPQLQHNMWVVAARSAVLSVITGGGKWVEITTHADPLYQHLIVTERIGVGTESAWAMGFRIRHPALRWMAATLDGRVEAAGTVFEAKFMLPWSFSEEAAAEKYMPQLQHNMWVVAARSAVLSVITGGGKWVEITTHADPLYQHLIVTAERKFWRCVESGEPPRLFGVEPPKPRIEVVRVVDMSASNSWAEFAGLFRDTRQAFMDHERSKVELKALMPEDAKEAIGHGIRAKRSKSGAVSFDLVEAEGSRAALQ